MHYPWCQSDIFCGGSISVADGYDTVPAIRYRHFPPNFYYDQEDYLAARVAGGACWTWNTLRPGPICGFSSGSFMNIVTSTALYATVAKELGLTHLR